MKRMIHMLAAVVRRVWSHVSALVAVILIVSALILGYQIGRPAPEAPATQDEVVQSDGPPTMYTCSMHPSVRLPDPDAKCPICFMDLIPVTDDGGEGNERRVSISDADVVSSRIETARVGRLFPTAEVRLYGKVTYDETSIARLTAYFPGRIDRLFVNFIGVDVRRGDHLAEIYSPDLLASFEELRQAAQAVNAGAGSAIMRDAAAETLVAAREKLRLFGVSDEQVRAIEAGSFDSDRLTVFAPIGGVVTHLGVREGEYVETGAPIATVANLSRLWLDLEAYESQLPMLRWGQPVTFTVEAHPGQVFKGHVSFIEPLVNDQTRTATVRVAVDNPDLVLKPGMFASAAVQSKMGGEGALLSDEFAGRWVAPMHPTIVRDEPGQCDVCGMDLVPAESLGIVADSTDIEEPLVIPRSAVLFTGARSVVYVEVPGADRPTYEGREVVLGPRAGELYVVRDGLAEGEFVVVSGAFRIDSAMQISAKPSMMSLDGTAADHRGRFEAPEQFVWNLKPIYAAYLDAQEALAADDLDGFTQAATDLQTALGFVVETGLVGEPLGAWRRSAARLRFDGMPSTIEDARTRFERMSDGVIDLQRHFGHRGSEAWHVAYCPMAFDDKGADWLQRGTQISNPYFGDSMLRCGEFRQSFEPIDRVAPASRAGEVNND